MSYRVQVSGKIFESDDLRTLLKRAVEARQSTGHNALCSSSTSLLKAPLPHPINSRLRKTGKNWAYSPQEI